MKRITVEEVKQAFEETGLTPREGAYLSEETDKFCACGLGALYIHSNGIEDVESEIDNDGEVSAWVDERYGLSYRVGFVRGFDNDKVNSKVSIRDYDIQFFNAGFEDGQNARKALIKGVK